MIFEFARIKICEKNAIKSILCFIIEMENYLWFNYRKYILKSTVLIRYFSPVAPLITNAILFGNCVKICRSLGSSEKRRLFG